MQVMDAIYKRRAVRCYEDRGVDTETIKELLHAAVQAPSAMNEQPWAFAVFQGRELLSDYARRATEMLLKRAIHPDMNMHLEMATDPHFDLFYNAPALIVLYSTIATKQAEDDCYLAAENMMLATVGHGLACCPIGFALPWLNLPEVKQELGIPPNYRAVLSVVVGYSESKTSGPGRKEPVILAWKHSPALATVDGED